MAAGTEEGHGRAGPGVLREEEGSGGGEGRGGRGTGSPRRRCCQRGAYGWRPGQDSRVLGARLGIRTPLRGDLCTVPSASASMLAAAAAAAAPAAAAHKAPPPRLSGRRRRQILSPSLAAGRGACREMQSRVRDAGAPEEAASQRGGGGGSANQERPRPLASGRLGRLGKRAKGRGGTVRGRMTHKTPREAGGGVERWGPGGKTGLGAFSVAD